MNRIDSLKNRWNTESGFELRKLISTFAKSSLEHRVLLISRMSELPEWAELSKTNKLDFRGLILSDTIIENKSLESVDMSFVVFENCHFKNVEFNNAYSSYSVIKGCTFEKCAMSNVNFIETEIHSSNFFESTLYINFNNILVENVTLSSSKIRLGGTYSTFNNMKIQDGEFFPSRTNNCIFEGLVILNNQDITIHAPSCEFKSTELHQINFKNSNLNKCKFTNCNLEEIQFFNTQVNKAIFTDCSIKNVNFNQAIYSKEAPPIFNTGTEGIIPIKKNIANDITLLIERWEKVENNTLKDEIEKLLGGYTPNTISDDELTQQIWERLAIISSQLNYSSKTNYVDLRGMTIANLTIHSKDLQSIDLSFCTIINCHFNEADLTDANLYYANLQNCVFTKSNLNSINGKFCEVSGGFFQDSTFAQITLLDFSTWNNCKFKSVSFNGSLLGARFLNSSFYSVHFPENTSQDIFVDCSIN